MNQDKVKEILLKYVSEETPDFTVIFTGKESSKVDGLYNRETQEILIHNRNFKSDNELLYTAFHELAHHIDLSKKGSESKRTHTKAFYSILNQIVDKAIEAGDYQDIESEFLDTVIETGKEHTRLLKRMGKELVELYDYCQGQNIAFEDVILRKTGMTATEAKSIMKMYAVDVSDEITGDLARKVSKIANPQKRKEAEQAAKENKPLPPAKPPKAPKDEEVYLMEQKKRIEKTIDKLQKQLIQVVEDLQGFEDGRNV